MKDVSVLDSYGDDTWIYSYLLWNSRQVIKCFTVNMKFAMEINDGYVQMSRILSTRSKDFSQASDTKMTLLNRPVTMK